MESQDKIIMEMNKMIDTLIEDKPKSKPKLSGRKYSQETIPRDVASFSFFFSLFFFFLLPSFLFFLFFFFFLSFFFFCWLLLNLKKAT